MKMSVEEFLYKWSGEMSGDETVKVDPLLKSDLRKVIEGLLPLKKFEGNIDWNDCIDYIRKRLDEELGGGK